MYKRQALGHLSHCRHLYNVADVSLAACEVRVDIIVKVSRLHSSSSETHQLVCHTSLCNICQKPVQIIVTRGRARSLNRRIGIDRLLYSLVSSLSSRQIVSVIKLFPWNFHYSAAVNSLINYFGRKDIGYVRFIGGFGFLLALPIVMFIYSNLHNSVAARGFLAPGKHKSIWHPISCHIHSSIPFPSLTLEAGALELGPLKPS